MSDKDPLWTVAETYFMAGFDAVIQIDVGDEDAPFWIDGRQDPPMVLTELPKDVTPDCSWAAPRKALLRLFSLEERRLESTYIAGRIAISGDMSVMARLETGSRAI